MPGRQRPRPGLSLTLWAALALASAPARAWTCPPDAPADAPAADEAAPAPTVPLVDRQGQAVVQTEGPLQSLFQLKATTEVLRERAAPHLRRLQAVHNFWHIAVAFDAAKQARGNPQEWLTPAALLQAGQGESFDVASAKYASLLAAGIPASRMGLAYAGLVSGERGALRGHTVLLYCASALDTDPWVLDNFHSAVLKASQRPELRPWLSYNADGWWHGTGPDPAEPIDPRAAVRAPTPSDWDAFLRALMAEGWR